jgi:hypothetical protein
MTTTDKTHKISSAETLDAAAKDGQADPSNGSPPRQPFGPWIASYFTERGKRRVTIGWAALLAALVIYFITGGIPESTNSVLLFVVGALVVSSLNSGVRWKQLVLDWLPLLLVLYVYSLLRGYAAHTIWGPFYRPQVWFDTHVFGGVAPTVQLQRWLYTPGLHFWDYLCWLCYTSHFFASFIIAGVLWKTNYAKFKRFVPLFVTLTFLGYLTYVFYPAMPPWMSSQLGHMPSSTRIIPVVFHHLHFSTGASVFSDGNRFDNNVAAMPSLHGAYPLLICLFFWKGSSVRKRILLAAYPICMAFTLVYTGEHFVIDIFMGWLYASAVFYFGSKLLDRWEARKLRKQTAKDAGLPAESQPSSPVPVAT